MGRTTCTEPQCLYKGALYLSLLISILSQMNPVHSHTSNFFKTHVGYKVVFCKRSIE